MAYFYNTFRATVSGSATRRVRCARCSCLFEYEFTVEEVGGGHSPFFLSNGMAAAKADERARINLGRKLGAAVVPAHCPSCGIYQPDMVRVLLERRWDQYDPNKYASDRISRTVTKAWQIACAENTIDAYKKFAAIWPTHDDLARAKIREIKYPRKLISACGWMAWGVLVLFVFIFALYNTH